MLPEETVRTRTWLLNEAARDGSIVVAYHLADTGLCRTEPGALPNQLNAVQQFGTAPACARTGQLFRPGRVPLRVRVRSGIGFRSLGALPR